MEVAVERDYTEEVKELFPDAVLFKLKGYTDGNTDYQKAKQSAVKGFTKDASVHLSADAASEHLKAGGWIGLLIPENTIVIDVDNREAAEKLQELLEGEGVNHHAIQTPNGRQFLFKCEHKRNSIIKQDSKLLTSIGVEIDTRVAGKGYIVYPTYNTENRMFLSKSLDGMDELPKYLVPIKRKASLPDPNYTLPIPLRDGSRNNDFSKWAGHLRAWEVPKQALTEAMKLIHTYFVEDRETFTEAEAMATIRSAVNWKPDPATPERTTADEDFDVIPGALGYFEKNKFIPQYLGEDIISEQPIVFEGKKLYAYEDGVYKEVSDYAIRTLCMEKLGKDFRKSYADETIHFIQVATFKPIKVEDPNTKYINVKNGLLEWETGELHPHTPQIFSKSQLPVTYNTEAKCPKIQAFLKSVLPEDTLPLIEEWFGYCMLPTSKYGKALMLIGSGSNGKSKFIELFEAFIGSSNITNVPLQDLEHNRFKLANLYGKLANTSADLSTESLRTSSTFKNVVTGDRVSAEFKGKDSFDFKPYARLMFSANELPRSSDLTPGFFRRWFIVPFNNKFGPGGQPADPDLMEKLLTEEELSGLLNVALNGLHRLEMLSGFTLNESTEEELKKYRREIDNVAVYVDEQCILDEDQVTLKQDVFNDYLNWSHASGYRPMGKVKFYKRFEELAPVTEVRPDKRSGRAYKGIGVDPFM